ncbi:adenosylcobinamide-phosphate synthase CbiB [Alkalihalophilus marmarensis]|jgi:adenosylcobinamide-phosphate synthase|uniref:Cobalamin biosynthesis protein CobD n=1 Tax=Alkalihalophilus marmarensis DSM 21297 TaxID=1188261 RepID=U6SR60_9BACI|nr:adenosylcobinamide-phosphate synthase CbiB [Alkalihalophilus marmarensis]ERN54113.1 cobalamin biosynthesis protein CobD [Alkalihalophilus marmarensis DSM 21297]MCM3488464.1 adenosylcobinamide-phosphate synthase CbiB [Alkalihalophilus marmarensis]
MILYHLMALTLAVIIDRLIGDPKWLPHPVVGMGKIISFFEKRLNKGSHCRIKGFMMMLFLLTISGGVLFIIVYTAYSIHIMLGIMVEAWFISTTIAAKGLKQAALDVWQPLVNKDLNEARKYLSYIVGRDTTNLKEEEITRATIETVSENTSDGITAPLFYALLGGAPLAMIYRAVNTGDSMVGYKNERYSEFGYAAAKLDDLFNLIPSRMTGLIMIMFNRPALKRSRTECFNVLLRDAKKHPSPNSGWGEAAAATLMGIQLGGRNVYGGQVSERARMGDSLIKLLPEHILAANRLMIRTVFGFTILLWMIGGMWYVLT